VLSGERNSANATLLPSNSQLKSAYDSSFALNDTNNSKEWEEEIDVRVISTTPVVNYSTPTKDKDIIIEG
jgi:hypothetical protein